MKKVSDAVIIGGGIAGTSIAFHLAECGLKNIVVLEKEQFLGAGSSAASAGIIYHHFPQKINRQLSRASFQSLLEFEDKFGAPISMRRNGCIQTAGTPADLAVLKEIHQDLLHMGVDAHFLAPPDVAEIIPGLVTSDLLGAIHTPGDGWFDPHSVLQTYVNEARRLGAQMLTGTPATGIFTEKGKVEGIATPAGNIASKSVIDSAGPMAGQVAEMAGLRLPIRTVKRQIFISAPTTAVPPNAPFYFDRTPPLYFRPESPGLLMSIAEMDESPIHDLKLDWTRAGTLALRATHRMPALESLQLMRGWAGLRCMTPDNVAILGPAPEPKGFYFACGFSGHGVMHSPLTGKILAHMILHPSADQFTDITLAPLRVQRFFK